MQSKRAEILLLCRPDEETDVILDCCRSDGRVEMAEYCNRERFLQVRGQDTPDDTVRIIVLDDVLFDFESAREYFRIIARMPRTAGGVLLHGKGLERAGHAAWNAVACRARCTAVISADKAEEGVEMLVSGALRLCDSAWPEKSAGRVHEAVFIVNGDIGPGGMLHGTIMNRYIPGSTSFSGIEGLLISIDGLCDVLDFPQRSYRPRSLGQGGRRKKDANIRDALDYRLFIPDNIDAGDSQISFCVKVKLRAFCSIQGEICGVSGKSKALFYSAEEFAKDVIGIIPEYTENV